jgi:membrane-associated PAP2 superfamily phosphatase
MINAFSEKLDRKFTGSRNFTLLNPAFGRATKGGIQQGKASSIFALMAVQFVTYVSCHKILNN